MKLSLFGTTRHSGALVINHLSIIHRKENDYQKLPLLYFLLILQILPAMPKNFTTSKIFNVSDQFGIWL